MSILGYIGVVLFIIVGIIADVGLVCLIAYFLMYIVEALRYLSE